MNSLCVCWFVCVGRLVGWSLGCLVWVLGCLGVFGVFGVFGVVGVVGFDTDFNRMHVHS